MLCNIETIEVRKKYIRKFFLLLLVIVYRIIIDFSYINAIVELFRYNGFIFEWDAIRYFESYLYILLPFIFMPIDDLRLSSVFINMQFAFMVVPMTSIYGLSTQSSFFMLLISTMHVMQSILFRIKTNIPRIKIDSQGNMSFFHCFILL